MVNSKVLSKILIFLFGFCLGGFIAVSIVREAVPLRDHYYIVVIYSIYIIPIIVALIVWYINIIRSCRKILGDEKGDFIGTILTYVLVSVLVIFILVIGIFYTAIA